MQLGFGEVRVWQFGLDVEPTQVGRWKELLAPNERARASRFVTEELQTRYIAARAHLRILLGEFLELEPQQIHFDYEQWGKPYLSKGTLQLSSKERVHFNVSHSEGRGLIAIGSMPLGIDLELFRPRVNYRSIISQVVSASEESGWAAWLPRNHDEHVLQLWVCKEALLKAMGLGIAEGLQKTSLPIPIPRESFRPSAIDASLQLHLEEDGSCRLNSWMDPKSWRLQLLDGLEEGVGALATLGPLMKLTLNPS
ncbi:MAG: 4'-phosphopantetheinyl transferase superfamily protein [Planctomycetota bacterium]|nr:4'-phosphopantetheinyl transferase superfamily protein [Planctomycetota bacterium]